MNITLHKPVLCGEVGAIPSKSHAHRLFIASAFANRPTLIHCPAVNRDISATVDCLRSLGANISEISDGTYNVEPISQNIREKKVVLDVGESGSTLRFLLPVALAVGADSSFVCHGRLSERPLSPMYEQLVSHGAVLSPMGENPFSARGHLSGGEYTFSGGVSSQFTTGLLLALPLLCERSIIRLTGKIESRPYIDITLRLLGDFGVSVTESDSTFTIDKGGYVSPDEVYVEGDWSNAAFFLVAGAFSEDGITVRGLDVNSPQGDRAIIKLLSDFGADVTINGDRVTVRKLKNKAPDTPIDAADIPDLIPILSVIASVAEGETVIENCARLRLKESDRLQTIFDMLTSLGANVEIRGDSLVIRGVPHLSGGVVSSFNDHRIAMAASVASTVSDGDVTIEQAEAVAKSYPDFFKVLDSLTMRH